MAQQYRYETKAVVRLSNFHYLLESGVRADREAKTANPILTPPLHILFTFVLKCLLP